MPHLGLLSSCPHRGLASHLCLEKCSCPGHRDLKPAGAPGPGQGTTCSPGDAPPEPGTASASAGPCPACPGALACSRSLCPALPSSLQPRAQCVLSVFEIGHLLPPRRCIRPGRHSWALHSGTLFKTFQGLTAKFLHVRMRLPGPGPATSSVPAAPAPAPSARSQARRPRRLPGCRGPADHQAREPAEPCPLRHVHHA